MSSEIFYLIGYLILILVLWLIPIIRNILISHKPELIGFSSGYIFLLADIKSSSDTILCFNNSWKELNSILIIVGLLLGIIGIILSAIEKSKLRTLKEIKVELETTKSKLLSIKEDYYKLCSDNIKETFSSFFEQSNGNGRVSLYKHEGNSFKLLGRFSNNPVYNKRGREVYSDIEGFISLGWQRGTFEIHSAPAWTGNSGTQYRNFMKEQCQISDDVLKKLTMKSRSFYIYRFDNDNAQNPYGVIVFEKINEIQIQTATIELIFGTYRSHIANLLKSMKTLN